MIMKNALLDAFNFRHACKLFDASRKIPQTDLGFILEAGCLSPSSMGLEHWKFIVVQTPQLKADMQHACSDQPQIGIDSCPIGAFKADQARDILQIDDAQYEVALALPLGYRKNPQSAKHRLPFSDLVEFR